MKFEEGIRQLVDSYFNGNYGKSLVSTDSEIELTVIMITNADCSHCFKLKVDCKTYSYLIHMFPVENDYGSLYGKSPYVSEENYKSFFEKIICLLKRIYAFGTKEKFMKIIPVIAYNVRCDSDGTNESIKFNEMSDEETKSLEFGYAGGYG